MATIDFLDFLKYNGITKRREKEGKKFKWKQLILEINI